MCTAILISGICSDKSWIVYDTNRRPSWGNCFVWDSMTSVRAAVLIHQVSIPFLRAQGAHVWGSGHFSISSLDSALSSSENGAHQLLGPLLLVSPSWRTISAVLDRYSRFCAHCIFCIHMFLKTLLFPLWVHQCPRSSASHGALWRSCMMTACCDSRFRRLCRTQSMRESQQWCCRTFW